MSWARCFVLGAVFSDLLPGTVVWDMAEMAAMSFGLREMTTWHPVLVTWMFSGLVRFGRLFGSDNLGVFLFTMLQSALLAYALARALELMKKLNAGRAFRVFAFAFFALTPIFPSFAQAVGKDTVYAALVLLFTIQTTALLRFGKPKPAVVVGYGLTALLMCLSRHNGVYLLLPTAVVLAFVLRGNVRRLASAALGAALALVLMVNGLLLPALGITDATASGIYSAAFQQSARVLRDHEVTAEEYTEIDAVLDAENLPALYEPNISDPVKYTFKQYGLGREAETEALARYRETWLTMLAEYPLTYLEAFVAGNTGYYAFTPKIDAARTYNYQGGIRFTFETIPAGDDPLDLHTAQIPAFAKARELARDLRARLAARARPRAFPPLRRLHLAARDRRALPHPPKTRPRPRRLPARAPHPPRLPPLPRQRLFPLFPASRCNGLAIASAGEEDGDGGRGRDK